MKANVKSDRRLTRRAMTEAELVKLLHVARWRPLAERVPTSGKPCLLMAYTGTHEEHFNQAAETSHSKKKPLNHSDSATFSGLTEKGQRSELNRQPPVYKTIDVLAHHAKPQRLMA